MVTKKNCDFKMVFQRAYDKAAGLPSHAALQIYEEAKSHYSRGHRLEGKEQEDALEKAENLFGEYRDLVVAKVPGLRDPKEDRHLYYLTELKDRRKDASVSHYGKWWSEWQKEHGTLAPNELHASGSSSSSSSNSSSSSSLGSGTPTSSPISSSSSFSSSSSSSSSSSTSGDAEIIRQCQELLEKLKKKIPQPDIIAFFQKYDDSKSKGSS